MRLHAYLLFDRSLLYHSEFCLKIRERERIEEVVRVIMTFLVA